MRILLFLAAMLFSCAQVFGQTPASDAEKIRDISPDGQFAMRIVYDEESNKEYGSGSDEIAKQAMRSVDLVTLPSKKSITNLFTEPAENTSIGHLIWSEDSKWFAIYGEFGRGGDTYIYRRSGEEFVSVGDTDKDQLHVTDTKGSKHGDVHNSYVRPVRWIKPGVLLLEQTSMFRGGGYETFQFSAGVDPKSGKLRILSKKKLRSES